MIELKSTPLFSLRRTGCGAIIVLLLASLQSGCSSTLATSAYAPPVAEDVRTSARTVAVVSTVATTDDTAPRLDVPIGQGKEAAKGAAAGAGTGLLTGIMVSAAGGPLGAVLAPIVIPAFVLGGMAGGSALRLSAAVPAKDAEAAQAALSRSRSDLSAELARRVALRLTSVGKVAASAGETAAPDVRIELAIDRWGLAGGAGSDPLTGFYARVSYRVVNGLDNSTVAEGSFVEGGPQRTVSEWTRDDAALLSKAVDTTLNRIAEAIVDDTFLVHNFHVLMSSGPVRGEVCGLRPIKPSSKLRLGPFESGSSRVESLTPRLVWESFPRQEDMEADAANVLAHVSDIRYDLRIWKGENGGPDDVVYDRTALMLTTTNGAVEHTLETPLAADSSYLWSVRARLKLDGRERVTRWAYDPEIDMDAIPLGFFGKHGWLGTEDPYRQSYATHRDCVEDSIPPLHYFGFTTPRD